MSGEIDWPGRSGTVHANLDLSVPRGVHAKLELQWPEGVAGARASVGGEFGTQAILAQAPAP